MDHIPAMNASFKEYLFYILISIFYRTNFKIPRFEKLINFRKNKAPSSSLAAETVTSQYNLHSANFR